MRLAEGQRLEENCCSGRDKGGVNKRMWDAQGAKGRKAQVANGRGIYRAERDAMTTWAGVEIETAVYICKKQLKQVTFGVLHSRRATELRTASSRPGAFISVPV